MKFVSTHATALFCLLTGILLLLIGSPDFSSSRTLHAGSSGQEKWYLILGITLITGGVVRFIREKTI